jgi:hypothetical protein
VPSDPPGEGDGGATRFTLTGGRQNGTQPDKPKGPVGQATCTATQTVSGVNPAAGGAVGPACKISPGAGAVARNETLGG